VVMLSFTTDLSYFLNICLYFINYAQQNNPIIVALSPVTCRCHSTLEALFNYFIKSFLYL